MLLPGMWTSGTSSRCISRHIDRMFRRGFVLLRRPELTAFLTRVPRAWVLITLVGRAQCTAFVLLWATAATLHRHKRRIAAYPLLTTGRLHSRRRGIATKPTMLPGNRLRFHPIVRHHFPFSRVVASMGGAHHARFAGASRRGLLYSLRPVSPHRVIARRSGACPERVS